MAKNRLSVGDMVAVQTDLGGTRRVGHITKLREGGGYYIEGKGCTGVYLLEHLVVFIPPELHGLAREFDHLLDWATKK